MMDISFSNELSYMSASSSSQEMFFYSVPTSPNILKLRQQHGYQTGPTTPRSYEEETGHGFEFETGRGYVRQSEEQQKVCGDSLPTMAFADELFCDGKVMPLKLPPRLFQKGDHGNIMSSTQSSTVTSPKSPGSMLRLPFSRLWKDDFDPFMVALEKVREDKRGNSKAKHDLRRTRSHCDTTTQLIYEELLKQASGRENILFDHKVLEVESATDKNLEFELKRNSVSKVVKETKKDESQKGGFLRRNIKKFLFRKANMSRHKLQDKKEARGKAKLLKKVDMESVTSTQPALWNEDERTGELTKMRLVCHRPLPKFSLCLGYEGLKGK